MVILDGGLGFRFVVSVLDVCARVTCFGSAPVLVGWGVRVLRVASNG